VCGAGYQPDGHQNLPESEPQQSTGRESGHWLGLVVVVVGIIVLVLVLLPEGEKGGTEQTPAVALADPGLEVSHLQRGIWSRPGRSAISVQLVVWDRFDRIRRNQNADVSAEELVEAYLPCLYSDNTFEFTKAVEAFPELPEEVQRTVEPALFAILTHNEMMRRRWALTAILEHGSGEMRGQVAQFYLSTSPVIGDAIEMGVADGGSDATEQGASPMGDELSAMIAAHQWRSPGPSGTWGTEPHRLDEFLLPKSELKAAIEEVHDLVRKFSATPGEATLQALIPHLYSRDWKLRAEVFSALHDVTDAAYEMIHDFVLAGVVDEHPEVRIAAIELLCVRAPERTAKLRSWLTLSPHKEIAEAALCGKR
jgi:hypothetical protein